MVYASRVTLQRDDALPLTLGGADLSPIMVSTMLP